MVVRPHLVGAGFYAGWGLCGWVSAWIGSWVLWGLPGWLVNGDGRLCLSPSPGVEAEGRPGHGWWSDVARALTLRPRAQRVDRRRESPPVVGVQCTGATLRV